MNTKFSENFSHGEFACHCGCGKFSVSSLLILTLEWLRKECGDAPIKIVSGVRCEKHNSKVKGALKSQHLLGTAADIRVQGYTPKQIYKILDTKYPNKYGIGLYKTWVHIDVRNNKARWVG